MLYINIFSCVLLNIHHIIGFSNKICIYLKRLIFYVTAQQLLDELLLKILVKFDLFSQQRA